MKSICGKRLVGQWIGRLGKRAARLGRQGIDLLCPPRCLHCEAELPPEYGEMLLCTACCEALGPANWPGCPRCGALEDADWAMSAAGCPACHNLRLRFQTVIPLGPYDGALRDAVLKTKRSYHEQMSLALGQLLLRRRERELNDFHPDLVVPIPMHWTRRFRRGINSPELLAGCLGRRLRVPVADWLLVRTRNTLPQKDLTPQDRFRNVRGAFRVRRGQRRRLQGSRVLLVDDILTTGATCSEAAAVLRRAGASAVAAAVLARAQGRR
ncbi:MAG: ComF family protein [Thermoguttaceae bacterium]